MMTQQDQKITAANFDETFNLDYAVSLADGLSNLDEDSSAVTSLVKWCLDRGYVVSREVATDVLLSQIEYLAHRGEATL